MFLWLWLFENTLLAMILSSLSYGVAAAIYIPSQLVAIPLFTGEETRQKTNALLSGISSLYALLGPLLGVLLITTTNFAFVLCLDAITFLAAIVLLRRIRQNLGSNTSSPMTQLRPSGTKQKSVAIPKLMPHWVCLGLIGWFIWSVAIGLIGVAGPSLVMAKYDAFGWALVATAMAMGALAGSTAAFIGVGYKLSWPLLYFICGTALSLQLCSLAFPVALGLIAIAGFLGSALVAMTSIRWDTIGQRHFKAEKLHAFAAWDQMASTCGVPLGMLIFAAAGYTQTATLVTLSLAIFVWLFSFPVLLSERSWRI